ncbi:efflux RND transporter periplasmic adaptor subunit [Streptomyces sp. NBC_01264]|uniref:efflux RND transporter periplasmic adaptor subunit n=1 Tax=Streptomyces sp. NBC_01264 TaxID=2903804 RepID=UPI00225A52D5|nr:efflux RND transporter periplasmic adaptor subunit [Streptomyces sp. NBC_01264]MCX4779894.1 efflux RND transporter periplasmic adaptor subunit [Streptomyces sp. NBC_01264]
MATGRRRRTPAAGGGRRMAAMYGVLGAVLMGSAAIPAHADGSTPSPSAKNPSPTVPDVEAGTGPSASGTVESLTSRSLSFTAEGTITTLKVKAGQKVEKGDVLAQVDSTEAVESRSAAYASYLAASETLEESESGSEGYRKAYASYVKARNTYRKAERAVDGTKIVAPFAGTVTALDAEAGQSVSRGATVLTLTDLSALQVSADFTEADIVKLNNGQKATVTFGALNTTVQGSVSSVSPVPVASESSGSGTGGGMQQSSTQVVRYTVLISLADLPATVRAGQAVTVEVQV